jgi:hypothetical protein
MQRFPDWPTRLHRFLRDRRSLPYAWGANDCCAWVQDWVLLATGVDIMPGVTRPTSAIGAAKFLHRHKVANVEGLAIVVLGGPIENTQLAGRGDVVSFWANDEPHLAIAAGAAAATPAAEGLVWIPRHLWRHGWKVG